MEPVSKDGGKVNGARSGHCARLELWQHTVSVNEFIHGPVLIDDIARSYVREPASVFAPHLAFFQRVVAMIRKRLADDAGGGVAYGRQP